MRKAPQKGFCPAQGFWKAADSAMNVCFAVGEQNHTLQAPLESTLGQRVFGMVVFSARWGVLINCRWFVIDCDGFNMDGFVMDSDNICFMC